MMAAQLPDQNVQGQTYNPNAFQNQSLDAIFMPKSVAVIGASEKPDSLGRVIVENLTNQGFKGKVYPVNPHATTILGRQAFPSVKAIESPIDLAVIVTPAVTVPPLLQECVEAGVRSAIVISAGFKERDETGAELERELTRIARQGRLRLVGPNCLGVMRPAAGLNATFSARMALPGNVAFISQSGALCTAVLDWSLRENIGFSAFISVGSMAEVGWGDLIDYLGDDPLTKSIIIYMESVGDARSFLSAAREVALSKPVIVLKAGRTSQAAQAATSHTGALTGSDAVLDAAFERCGVLRVDTIDELFYMAEALAMQPRPNGPRLAIVTNAGGPGVLATDALIQGEGELAKLSEDTLADLNEVLPRHWSHNNPVDIIGDATPQRYRQALEIISRDPACDGCLVILTPQSMTNPSQVASEIKQFAKTRGKTILTSLMGGAEVAEAADILTAAGIPNFPYPDMAARVFNYMWRYSRNLDTLYETPVLPDSSPAKKEAQAAASQLIDQAYRDGRLLLNEIESKQLLQAYGLPTVKTCYAGSEEAAIHQAEEIGYPVVLKLFSSTITHKSDAGGVHLNLNSADEVVQAYRLIEAGVIRLQGKGAFEGVTVQPMVASGGYELIIGSSLDPQFGPVLLFGAGGQLVETLQDKALGLPPLTSTLARLMMQKTRIYWALQGVRGRQPVDLAALKQLLVEFSYLVAEQPRIKEIDINPLLVSASGLTILDARVVLVDPALRTVDLPALAIRPYPTRYIMDWTLRDGTPVTIRPIRPEDEPLMLKFNQTLSDDTIYYRYLNMRGLAARTSHTQLTRVCFVDYDREIVLVADHCNPATGEHEITGVGQISKIQGTNEAELALLIADAFQGKGLGEMLTRTLLKTAALENVAWVVGDVHPANRRMLDLCRKLGFQLNFQTEEETVKVRLPIDSQG